MKTIIPVLEGYSVDGGPVFGTRKIETGIQAFKIEEKNGELIQRALTPEEQEKEGKYAQSVLEAFIPRRMPLGATEKATGAFK